MNTPDQTPAFNLKVVVHETGLKPDTLRAWERRYGLPAPQRTPGGHRLYSRRDVDMFKWLVARQAEGLSISRAAALWKQLEADGKDPLRERPLSPPAAAPPLPSLPAGSAIAGLRREWLSACLQFDEPAAENTLAQAFALYPPEVTCVGLLQAGLHEMGEMWYRNEAGAQQEHFASALAMRRLQNLLAATPPAGGGGGGGGGGAGGGGAAVCLILAGCPPGEEHAFITLLLTLLLRRQGWRVVHLGAGVPLGHMETTLSAIKPDLVVMPAQQLRTAATLLEMAQFLHTQTIPLAFGGRIFNRLPDLIARTPGYFLGHTLPEALQMIETLLGGPPRPLTAVAAPTEAYRQAVDHFQRCRAYIEAEVVRQISNTPLAGLRPAHLSTANHELGDAIIVALKLGDMNFLDVDIRWVEGMLANRNLPAAWLRHFLVLYLEAARSQLDEPGQPVLDWLANVTQT
ncbi:MAG: MerR family transcriptional regulator [Anaerolineae bacterium]